MKRIFLVALVTLGVLSISAQDVKLPAVTLSQSSKTVVEALASRHSVRAYADKKLSLQEISNLCWAACGVARDAEHRTAPTAMNRKEIRLFVITDEAAYEYMAKENTLRFIAKGDNRALVAGGQQFVETAPLSLVMVIDFEIFGRSGEKALMMGCVDAGNVSENVNLYCEAVGLVTVPRATMNVAELSKLLGLTDKQLPIMNNPVGYPKK